jgi:arginase
VKQPEEQHYGEKRAKYLHEIAETCRGLAEMTERSLAEGFLPLVLGGDHSLAVGSFSGVSNYFRGQSKRVGYLWLDAHGDMNTPESSPSGNIHGMPLAAIIGYGAPELVELLGLQAEGRAAQRGAGGRARSGRQGAPPDQGVRRARLHHARYRRARHARCDERSAALRHRRYRRHRRQPGHGFCRSHDAPGVGTPVRGGVTYREAHLAMEMIADSEAMVSLEIVEINPVIDLHNQTALLGVEMVLSGLGKKIL